MNEQANDQMNEQISAYVDGALSGRELAQFEAALAADADLARKVTATQALTGLARQLPQARLPRSFTLPANARPEQTLWEKLFGPIAPPQKAFRFGSAMAGLLCVFFLGMGLLNANAPISSAALDVPATPSVKIAAQAAAPTAETSAMMSSAMNNAPPSPRSAPPVIGGMGGGGGPAIGGLGGGTEVEAQSADVVPTNVPLPSSTPSPTHTPAPKPTQAVTVPQVHTTSLSWAWIAAAVVALAAAIMLGVLGFKKS
ncbi:MAG: zf-HC2 domain-containing protein [Dermatophilaceae bacterium]